VLRAEKSGRIRSVKLASEDLNLVWLEVGLLIGLVVLFNIGKVEMGLEHRLLFFIVKLKWM